jgi:hypothetical protein
MYGLPKDFDGSFFIGREVGHVSFTANTVFVSFDNAEVSITILSSFEHRTSAQGGGPEIVETVPVAESKLMQLIGHSVEAVEATTEGTLTLRFEHGHILRCFDDTTNYECYWVTHGADQIIV